MWSPTHVQVAVHRAQGLLTKGKNDTNDCFVTIALGKEKYQTSVKEKASKNVEWHEECELQIPTQGNTAEIVFTALHQNFLGVDEFLGTVAVPLSSFDVYERPKNRWYPLEAKPGKKSTKERGQLEVKISFIVKAGSLTDLTRKEKHKSSLGQLSSAAQSIGGSLLSIGSLEKRKGLKKLAKSIGSRIKNKSKNKLDRDEFNEYEEHDSWSSGQKPGEADPGVISEDDDEFTFDDLSHKSSMSSLNAPVTNGILSNYSNNNTLSTTTPPPGKPPRINNNNNNNINSSNNNSNNNNTSSIMKVDNQEQDEWGRKLYDLPQKKWDNKPNVIVESKEQYNKNSSPKIPSSPTQRLINTPEPPSPAPREIIHLKRTKDDKVSAKDHNSKEQKYTTRDRSPMDDKFNSSKSLKDEKLKSEKSMNKDKDKENKIKDIIEKVQSSSERIIIGGEDNMIKKTTGGVKSRLPHEVLAKFEGKTREDLIEIALQLQTEVINKKNRVNDLENYIDSLLLRIMETTPRILQNPYPHNHRLQSLK